MEFLPSSLIPAVFFSAVTRTQKDWGVIYPTPVYCSLEGSAVNMSCINLPKIQVFQISDKFWCALRSNGTCVDLRGIPEYRGRVEFGCEADGCTLRITELRGGDATRYSFAFTHEDETHVVDPGVSLVVSGNILRSMDSFSLYLPRCGLNSSRPYLALQVAPTTEPRCHSLCPELRSEAYVWYRNGRSIVGQHSWSYSGVFDGEGKYSCALRGLEDAPSPPVCEFTDPCRLVVPVVQHFLRLPLPRSRS